MKKYFIIFTGILVVLPSILFATDAFYNYQHYKVVADTNAISNDLYFRGDIYVTTDTLNVNLASCTYQTVIYSSGIIKNDNYTSYGGTISLKTDGTNLDFTTTRSSSTFYNQLYLQGSVNATGAVTLSTTTINGTVTLTSTTMNAPLGILPFTEAELKVTTPTAAGQLYYDSTNKSIVVTTGTSTCFDYGLIYDGTQAPTGW